MRAITTRIGISVLGGILLTLSVINIINHHATQNWIISAVLFAIGAFLIYKGRYF